MTEEQKKQKTDGGSSSEVVFGTADRLERCEAERKEYLDGWKRAKADALNEKKRQQQFLAAEQDAALVRYATVMLPVLDSVRAALGQSSDSTSLLSGIEQIHTQYLQSLGSTGITVLDPVGEPFDPYQHEAVGERSVASPGEHERVVAVARVGAKVGDRVIRAASVYVGKYAGE